MTTYTITTPVNIDTLVSKTGGDIYNIDGGYLTIDQDSRYGLNANTSATMGNITLSATLGGSIEFNAAAVRLIAYTAGSGLVPSPNTIISAGSASGKLIGVYSALNVAPTDAGAAMPVSGFIKVKQVTGSYAAQALSGISATATGVDRAGWIEICGNNLSVATVNRLNMLKVRGDWYDFQGATTSGSSATTYQIPSNGSLVYLPGVWVETATASNQYEFYPCAGTATALPATLGTEAARGKFCWISTAGLLRFQNDGTNTGGGFLPPAGRRIRIPNIIFTNALAASPTTNVVPNATLATRYRFLTTGGGVIDIDKGSISWQMLFSQAYSITITNTGIMSQLNASEIGSPINFNNVGVGQEAALYQTSLVLSLCSSGGSVSNCTWTTSDLASTSRYVISITACNGISFNNNKMMTLAFRGNLTTGSATLVSSANISFSNTALIAGRLAVTSSINSTFTNTTYVDRPSGTTTSTFAHSVFDVVSGNTNLKFDGVDFGGLLLCQSYNAILAISGTGNSNIKLRNIGTYSSPLEGGGDPVDSTWTRSSSTITVTTAAPHNLKVGDNVYVESNSSTAAITIGLKSILTVPTTTTYTFTGVNAGSASGSARYYPIVNTGVINLANGAGATDVKVQRCYMKHVRTLWGSDNTSSQLVLENVAGDGWQTVIFTPLNTTAKGGCHTSNLTSQTSVYGSHWCDEHMTATPVPNINGVSWSRAATLATITSPDHNLRLNMNILITTTSDSTTISRGLKQITPIDKDTFTFTATATGSTSGTLSFVPFQSRINILMNESTALSASQYSIDSGQPLFTSAGSLAMQSVGQQITFTSPYNFIGHTGFPVSEISVNGGTTTLASYDISYALDTLNGSGYGSFKALSYVRSATSGVSGASTFTLDSSDGIAVGHFVFGTGIGAFAKVTNIAGNTISVDVPNTATVSGSIRFNNLPNESLPVSSLGFGMKVRILVRVAGGTNLSTLSIITSSDATSRQYQFPLDPVFATLRITGIVPGTELRIFSRDGSGNSLVELKGSDSVDSGVFEYNYSYSPNTYVNIVLINTSYQYYAINGYLLASTDGSIPVQQLFDRQFSNPS